jgi:hypothetical protein
MNNSQFAEIAELMDIWFGINRNNNHGEFYNLCIEWDWLYGGLIRLNVTKDAVSNRFNYTNHNFHHITQVFENCKYKKHFVLRTRYFEESCNKCNISSSWLFKKYCTDAKVFGSDLNRHRVDLPAGLDVKIWDPWGLRVTRGPYYKRVLMPTAISSLREEIEQLKYLRELERKHKAVLRNIRRIQYQWLYDDDELRFRILSNEIIRLIIEYACW